jgi:hypothetical protein
VIRGFHQDASWFKALWRAEMPPFGRKQLRGAPLAKRCCGVAFNAQNAKAIFRETLTQPNWLVT